MKYDSIVQCNRLLNDIHSSFKSNFEVYLSSSRCTIFAYNLENILYIFSTLLKYFCLYLFIQPAIYWDLTGFHLITMNLTFMESNSDFIYLALVHSLSWCYFACSESSTFYNLDKFEHGWPLICIVCIYGLLKSITKKIINISQE